MMMQNKAYYVYKHTSPCGKVYIGITSYKKPSDRWRNGNGYSEQYFFRAIKKYGWENFTHEVLFSGLSKEQAEQKEIELISKYKSNQREYGYNIENGGHVHCVGEQTKEKLRGNHNACGHTISKEQHLRMIALSKTPEARAKLSKSKSHKVICIETNDVYENSLIAEKKTGVNFRDMRSVCRGKRKTAGGYHWSEVV